MRLALSSIAVTLLFAANLRAQDVTISTPYEQPLRSKVAKLYYNGRAVGLGKEGFQTILDRVAKLPAGTSIVWGPDYNRCGSCADGGNPLKMLHANEWSRLEKIVVDRQLVLSNAFGGQHVHVTANANLTVLPKVVSSDQLDASVMYGATIDWEVGAPRPEDAPRDFENFPDDRPHIFRLGDKQLDSFGLDLTLGQLPEHARLLIRLKLAEKASLEEPFVLGAIRQKWERNWAQPVRLGLLNVTVTAQANLATALNAPKAPLDLGWSNFHGPKTPHGGVLYFANGQYLGHGNSGFDQVLARLKQAPAGSIVSMPQYEFGGRSIAETLSDKKRAALNDKVRDLVPFAPRRKEFEAIVKQRQLNVGPSRDGFLRDSDPVTAIDWQSGDRYGSAFASFGRIIRHDEPRRKPAALLGWTRFEQGQPESGARYTLNDIETGIGDVGFEAAMNELAKLPAGSLVQVRVCIRTKPPFTCPLVYQGQRHFERTGYEPYVGMFPWLIDVAKKHRLQVEWLPDEGKSLQDCELNK